MSVFLDAALGYVERGAMVFPLMPRGKRPAGRLVPHGLHDATLDPDVVVRWWTAVPDANIGLPTGHTFDVVDVDGPEGRVALGQYMLDHGVQLGHGPWAWTGGDGDHLLFKPTGHGNRVAIVDHVDYRGAGGYIVAPPSVHPDTGERYEWEEERGGGFDEPLEPLPAWLLELVDPPPPTTVMHRAAARAVDTSAYGRGALEREAGRVLLAPEGTRNHTLNAAAFSLGQLVGGGVLAAGHVAETLISAATRSGLTEAEAAQTITSGMRAGLAQPRTAS